MSQPEGKPQPSPQEGSQQSSPAASGEAFQRAATLLAIDNEDSDEQARQTFVAIEGSEAVDRPPNPTVDSDALTQGITGDRRGDESEVADALDEKAREEGITAANDTSRSVWELTPHNL